MSEQLEFVKGSIVAAADIRSHLDRYLDNLQAKKADLKANEAASKRNKQELDVLKTRLEHELKEVTDVFKGELDEVNGKMATSERMLSHMSRYLAKIDAELQVVQEKLEVETYGRAELEELQRKLLQERAELRARIDAETKNSTSLTQHKRNLEDERDAKLASMKSDMQGVDNKIEAEKAAMQEWASLAKEEEGEESVLQRKLDANQEAHQEMEMTERRLRDILAEINAQTDAMTATIEDLEADKGRLEAEVQAVRGKVQSELDEVDFRLGVQAKAIAGLQWVAPAG